MGSLGFKLGKFFIKSALQGSLRQYTVRAGRGRKKAAIIFQSSQWWPWRGDGEKETFKRCSGGRMESWVTDGMWGLEREATQVMPGFRAWVMGGCW